MQHPVDVPSAVAGARPVVGVLGSGRHPWPELAEPLGVWLAECGVHLLTGGGQGVMASVCRAFVEGGSGRGLCIGVIPGDVAGNAPEGYPNPWVELVIRTHLPDRGERGETSTSRNAINVMSAHALVALPGGAGTDSEIAIASRLGKPLVIWRPGHAGATAHRLGEVQQFLRRTLGLSPGGPGSPP